MGLFRQSENWIYYSPRPPAALSAPVSSVTINCTVGNAVADGSTASIVRVNTINCTVGNAVANGSTASITRVNTINCTVGNAVADGSTATIQASVTINCTVGNAVADGATASIAQVNTINCTVGNAVADGSTASLVQVNTINCTVGNAVADGSTAAIQTSSSVTINCTVGNAVADGSTASLVQVNTISCTIGNAVADGSTASVYQITPITPAVFQSVGSFSGGGGDRTPGIPAGTVEGDFLVLLVESANEAIGTPAGWSLRDTQSTGTPAAAGGVRLGAYYQFAPASPVAPTIADTGDHTSAQIARFTGVHPLTPINTYAGSVQASASSSWTLPAVTTNAASCLIVNCLANDRDNTNTANLSGWANGNLTSITERMDQTTAIGAGGGLGMATGELVVIGDSGTTTVTNVASNTAAFITLALNPTEIGQTLTASLFTRPREFYAPTVSRQANKVLSAGLFTRTRVFYESSLDDGTQVLTAALFTRPRAFFTPTLILSTKFANGNNKGDTQMLMVNNGAGSNGLTMTANGTGTIKSIGVNT